MDALHVICGGPVLHFGMKCIGWWWRLGADQCMAMMFMTVWERVIRPHSGCPFTCNGIARQGENEAMVRQLRGINPPWPA